MQASAAAFHPPAAALYSPGAEPICREIIVIVKWTGGWLTATCRLCARDDTKLPVSMYPLTSSLRHVRL